MYSLKKKISTEGFPSVWITTLLAKPLLVYKAPSTVKTPIHACFSLSLAWFSIRFWMTHLILFLAVSQEGTCSGRPL